MKKNTHQLKESTILRGIPEEKLTPEAEDRLSRSGKLDTLVLHNMREGFFYARHVCRGMLPEDEVFSAVYRALEHASRNYKPGTKVGIRFFAYAKPYVRGALSREWKSKDVVKHAKHESLDVPARSTAAMMDNYDQDGVQNEYRDSNNKWEELNPVDPEFDLIHLHEQLEELRPVLRSELSEHERMVIELCYFGHFNFEEIGVRLGVSRSAIQNAHVRAMRKIRMALARKGGTV
jgi:RNA polymerase sigma factor (sigma-70 family)